MLHHIYRVTVLHTQTIRREVRTNPLAVKQKHHAVDIEGLALTVGVKNIPKLGGRPDLLNYLRILRISEFYVDAWMHQLRADRQGITAIRALPKHSYQLLTLSRWSLKALELPTKYLKYT